MKKHLGRNIALIVLLVLFAAGVLWFCGGETNVGGPIIDYAVMSPEDLYKEARLAVIGRYLGDERVYGQEDTGRPVTVGRLQIETVYKGETESETIPICFYGGTISLREHYAAYSWGGDERSLKDFIKKIPAWAYISRLGSKYTEKYDTQVDAQKGQEYLLFLSFDEEAGVYQVLSDAYGMRLLDENGKVYDPDSKSYHSLPAFLTKAQK